MKTRTMLAGGAVAAAAALAGGGIAAAASGDGEGSVTGPQAEAAKAAALEHTGGGTANEVEREDERGAAWEVEVTRPDGRTVDVLLDDQLAVVGVEADSESDDSDDGGADDDGASDDAD